MINVKSEYLLLAVSLLLLCSVFGSKLSSKIGVPSLLLFLLIGMIAGSEGLGGIYFDDPYLAQLVGVTALIFILFSSALDTDWAGVRPVIASGIALATLAVLISTVLIGCFCFLLLHFTFSESLLFGAIVSSTDAAAVFSVLRARQLRLKSSLKSLIEFESASNDPMAVLLTLGLIRIITMPQTTFTQFVWLFCLQVTMGIVVGVLMGLFIPWLINRINLEFQGLYAVCTIALVLLTYSITSYLHGSGFLAVYLAGLLMGRKSFVQKKEIMQFHEGLTWLTQIIMFLTLGLLVFPSRLLPVIGVDLLVAFFLILVARPLSVFLTLLSSRFTGREKLVISWLGLRGAVPIILATFPFVAELPQADLMFNLVFFIVLTSVLIQGTSIPWVARWLKVEH